MRRKTELTGRRRFRPQRQWFKAPLMVLQVEERRTGTEYSLHGTWRDYDLTVWRDATLADLTVTEPGATGDAG